MKGKHIIILSLVIVSLVVINILWSNAYKKETQSNDKLVAENEKLQASTSQLQVELEEKMEDFKELKDELDQNIQSREALDQEIENLEVNLARNESDMKRLEKLARDYKLKLPDAGDYKDMALYQLPEELYAMPYEDAKSSPIEDSIGFILGTFINEEDEEWLYVESLYAIDPDKRYGFIPGEALGQMIESKVSNVFTKVEIEGIRIGDSIYNLMKDYNHQMILEVEDEYWTIIADDYLVLIHPEDWVVIGMLTRNEDISVLDDITVGGSYMEAIGIFQKSYTNLINEEGQIIPNWFDLGQGIALSLDYDTRDISSSSTITEITLITIDYIK